MLSWLALLLLLAVFWPCKLMHVICELLNMGLLFKCGVLKVANWFQIGGDMGDALLDCIYGAPDTHPVA